MQEIEEIKDYIDHKFNRLERLLMSDKKTGLVGKKEIAFILFCQPKTIDYYRTIENPIPCIQRKDNASLKFDIEECLKWYKNYEKTNPNKVKLSKKGVV